MAIIFLWKEQAGGDKVKSESSGTLRTKDFRCGLCSHCLISLDDDDNYPGHGGGEPFCQYCGCIPHKFVLFRSSTSDAHTNKAMSLTSWPTDPNINASHLLFECCGRAHTLGQHGEWLRCTSCSRRSPGNHTVFVLAPNSESTKLERLKLIEPQFHDEIIALMID